MACLSLAADMLGEMAEVCILDLDWKTLVFFLLSVEGYDSRFLQLVLV